MAKPNRMSRNLPGWSQQIKAFRRSASLSQSGLASKLGITKKTVAEWEQGRQEPGPRRYVQLAKMAEGEQALWFLERVGLGRRFLGRVGRLIEEAN
jgi:transcriptional regulator with XRE-family HTH domain